MRINQNISALNAYRNMVGTENRLNKSLERLSSGLRINRAADDAAGLAISEKMRGQIQGLNQAMRNAQDGISLIQTAEGALNETHSILQRMRELSVQAANDTLTASDRMEIQKEIDQLTTEIDRIANTTEFNTKKLLDGTTSALTSTSDLKTQVFMRDGLRTVDQFGQKEVQGGNFKLDIEATPGEGQVQKTDIMKVNNDSGAYDVEVTQEASQLGLEVIQAYAEATAAEIEGGTTADPDSGELSDANMIITVDGTDYTLDLDGQEYTDVAAIVSAIEGAGDGGDGTLADLATVTEEANVITITHNTAGENTITVTYEGANATDAATLTGIEDNATATGTDVTPEEQTLNLGGADGGTFTLGDGGSSDTVPLDYDISAEDLATAIGGLTGIDHGVTVTGEDGSFTILFDAAEGASGLTFDGSELEGAVQQNEQQTITLVGAEGGTFTLTVDGEETASIDYDADPSAVETAINDALDDANKTVTVTGEAGAWVVEFDGTDFAGESQDLITMDTSGIEGVEAVGEIADTGTTLRNIDRFWDASGNFLVDDPQTITLVQGDGSKTSFTLFGTDTIQDVQDKLNNAIHEGLGQEEFNSIDPEAYAKYVASAEEASEFYSVEGTFVIQSAVTGSDGEITFVGDENIINALSLTTIQESSETLYDVTVTDAHTGEEVTQERISGNMLIGAVHENVDVRFDPMAGIDLASSATDDAFVWNSSEGTYETFVHLADNSMVFQIGANPLQDVDAAIGDMRAGALGVDNILVTNQDAANRAISQLDSAIDSVSAERSKLGAVQNRLDHTINNLGVAAENLTAAESRVRDLDFAQEMIEFTRNQIMQQAGTSMLAQANMKPQSVLMLLG